MATMIDSASSISPRDTASVGSGYPDFASNVDRSGTVLSLTRQHNTVMVDAAGLIRTAVTSTVQRHTDGAVWMYAEDTIGTVDQYRRSLAYQFE